MKIITKTILSFACVLSFTSIAGIQKPNSNYLSVSDVEREAKRAHLRGFPSSIVLVAKRDIFKMDVHSSAVEYRAGNMTCYLHTGPYASGQVLAEQYEAFQKGNRLSKDIERGKPGVLSIDTTRSLTPITKYCFQNDRAQSCQQNLFQAFYPSEVQIRFTSDTEEAHYFYCKADIPRIQGRFSNFNQFKNSAYARELQASDIYEWRNIDSWKYVFDAFQLPSEMYFDRFRQLTWQQADAPSMKYMPPCYSDVQGSFLRSCDGLLTTAFDGTRVPIDRFPYYSAPTSEFNVYTFIQAIERDFDVVMERRVRQVRGRPAQSTTSTDEEIEIVTE